MAEKHVFTSDEIRAATDRLEEFGALNGVYVVVGNSLQNWDVTGDDILAMLRQKASSIEAFNLVKEFVEYRKEYGDDPGHVIDKMMDFIEHEGKK